MSEVKIFQVGAWRVDVGSRSITNGATECTLSPRALRILKALARAQGDVVSRHDLLDHGWPNVTVTDESLTQVVSELRRAFRQGSDGETVVQTVAKSGYRIAVPVLIEVAIDHPAPQDAEVFDFEAYRLCLDARMVLSRSGPGSLQRAEMLAREAAYRAPNFALALAEHAVKLVQRDVYQHKVTPGLVEALEKSEAAVRLRPDLSAAHAAHGYALGAVGKWGEAKAALGRAMTCDHNDANVHYMAARTLFAGRDYAGATALAERAAFLEPEGYRSLYLASRAASAIDPVRAKRLAEQTLKRIQERLAVDPSEHRAVSTLGPLLAYLGEYEAAAQTMDDDCADGSPLEFYRVVARALLGDLTGAIRTLEAVIDRGWCYPAWLLAEPALASLHSERGYRRITEQLGVA